LMETLRASEQGSRSLSLPVEDKHCLNGLEACAKLRHHWEKYSALTKESTAQVLLLINTVVQIQYAQSSHWGGLSAHKTMHAKLEANLLVTFANILHAVRMQLEQLEETVQNMRKERGAGDLAAEIVKMFETDVEQKRAIFEDLRTQTDRNVLVVYATSWQLLPSVDTKLLQSVASAQ